MKTEILKHFAGDFRPFYEHYRPDLLQGSGAESKAKCPFHDDHDPSLSINTENGKFYCHGCGAKGDIFTFYALDHGMDPKADFPKVVEAVAEDFNIDAGRRGEPKIVARYNYLDAGGKIIFQVRRLHPKSFRQCQPNGQGGWKWSMHGVERVLYRLPDVLSADEVFIVEGEKDADNLARLGFTTTCNPGGAGKWLPNYTESLRGKDVVLIPDNDDPGRKHMDKVKTALMGVARSIKVLELPNLPEKGDVSDWLELFDDPNDAAERLALIVDGAEPIDGSPPPSFGDVIIGAKAFVDMDIPILETYIHPWLVEKSITLISGWRGIGKSWFVLALLNAVACGEQFGPWKVEKPVRCLYLDGEMVEQDVQKRLIDLNPAGNWRETLLIYCDSYATSRGQPKANLLNPEWRDKMKGFLIEHGVKLWAVDNISSLSPGIDEQSKADWDVVNQWLLDLRFAGIATILLHHVGKGGTQRGTSGREDNVNTSLILKPPHDYNPEDGARFVCEFNKTRGVPTKFLHLVVDTHFQLREDQDGRVIWTWGDVKSTTRNEVMRLLDEGVPQKDLPDILGVTKGRISQLKSEAIRNRHLTSDGRLTPTGKSLVFGNAAHLH